MQLGKALIGAIIGAAVGIVLMFLIRNWADGYWLAIPFALLVGMGVRMMVVTAGHASYARGALTGVLALVAYVGGWILVAKLAEARSAAAPNAARPVAAQEAKEETEMAAPAGEVAVVEQERPMDQGPSGPAMPNAMAPGQDPLDYVWLAIAALVAYELGRGTGAKPAETAEPAGPDAAPSGPAEA
jgi:hypothetical protein